MRNKRYIKPNSILEIFTKSFQGRLLLRPSELVNQIVLGILARALQKVPGIELFSFSFVSNHYHLILRAKNGRALKDFMVYLNGNISRKIGRLHNWNGSFWKRRYAAIPILDDEALVARMRYVLSHGAKEGLVASPRQWPGATGLPALLEGKPLKGLWFDGTAEYRARQRGQKTKPEDFATEVVVQLAPLPCWAHLPAAQQRAQVAEMIQSIEAETEERNRAEGHVPPGAEWVMAQDPLHQPSDTDHRRRPMPLCHASSKKTREEYKEEYKAFCEAYTSASIRLRAGELDVEFPDNCFPPPRPFVEGDESRAP